MSSSSVQRPMGYNARSGCCVASGATVHIDSLEAGAKDAVTRDPTEVSVGAHALRGVDSAQHDRGRARLAASKTPLVVLCVRKGAELAHQALSVNAPKALLAHAVSIAVGHLTPCHRARGAHDHVLLH
eukprot:scaffold69739_cov30-Tisochrysis_lutea.AAC.5